MAAWADPAMTPTRFSPTRRHRRHRGRPGWSGQTAPKFQERTREYIFASAVGGDGKARYQRIALTACHGGREFTPGQHLYLASVGNVQFVADFARQVDVKARNAFLLVHEIERREIMRRQETDAVAPRKIRNDYPFARMPVIGGYDVLRRCDARKQSTARQGTRRQGQQCGSNRVSSWNGSMPYSPCTRQLPGGQPDCWSG